MKLTSVLTLFCIFIYSIAYSLDEQSFIDQLRAYVTNDEQLIHNIMQTSPHATSTIPLFKGYPTLNTTLPYLPLGSLPTPITHAVNCGTVLTMPNLYIKRDDLSGHDDLGKRVIGGNKVRKLEFLLADALANQSRAVLTFGPFGSNHATATAYYANRLGLQPIVVLSPQAQSGIVQRNLLLMYLNSAHMIFSASSKTRKMDAFNACLEHKKTYGDYPYIIPTGGSCPRGAVGFVNAAFELQDQIQQGIMPEPDLLYIAVGSYGSIAGLLLGIQATGLKTKVVGIYVEPETEVGTSIAKIQTLFEQTNALLSTLDPSFPYYKFPTESVRLLSGFEGKGYGLFTSDGMLAQKILQQTEQIFLDGTYTAKTFAGLIHDVQHNQWHNKTILFWNTFWFSFTPGKERSLPEELIQILKKPIQPLDDPSLAQTLVHEFYQLFN